MKGGTVMYFAYGSNMNPAQMRGRCPDAERVGTAALRGWRLRERLYADVERAPGSVVRGVVYRLGMPDWEALCRYEGEPRVYRYQLVRAWLDGWGWCDVLVFHLSKGAREARGGKRYPAEYRARCSAGARANGLPDAFAAA
jgi:hypothetical protein